METSNAEARDVFLRAVLLALALSHHGTHDLHHAVCSVRDAITIKITFERLGIELHASDRFHTRQRS